MATKLKDVYDLHKRECWSCKTINEHEAAITPWVLCPHCGSQDTRRITPKVPPQAASSGEGLKVDPLTHPLARSGEQQFAVLCRQRSGIDSGNITEVTRPFQIEELCNQDQKDIALSSINLAITVLRHCKTENKSDLMHWVRLLENQVSNHIPPAQAEPVEAKPWVPMVGEKVLAEAVVCKIKPARDGYADVEILDHYYYADTGEASDLEDPNRIRVPLSQLRPLPVVQGENLGNS